MNLTNTFNYVKSLLPSFKRDRVIDDIARMQQELQDSLLPSLNQAAKTFRGKPFQSNLAKTIEDTLQHELKMHKPLFEILTKIFSDTPALLTGLEKWVQGNLTQDVEKESLTYRRANVIRLLEMISAAIKYTNRTALRVIRAESATEAGMNDGVDSYYNDRERDYFRAEFEHWLTWLAVLAQSHSTILATLESVPDVQADEGSAGAMLAIAGNKVNLDPFKLNLVPPSYNPIYHVRMWLAETEVAAIERSKIERTLVELHLRELELKRASGEDPTVERAIEVNQNRLKKLDFKIDKAMGVAG